MKRYYYNTENEKKRNSKTFENLKGMYPEIELIKGSPSDLINKVLKLEKGDIIYFNDYFKLLDDFPDETTLNWLYKKCYQSGIDLYFVNTPVCNTSFTKDLAESFMGYSEEALDDIISKIVAIEVGHAKEIRQIIFDLKRTYLQTAKANGVQIGVKKGTKFNNPRGDYFKKKIVELSKSFNGNFSDVDLIAELNIPRTTFYKYKKEIKQEIKAI